MRASTLFTTALFVAVCATLSSCIQQQGDLPTGEITVTGELRPAVLSLYRRGSHLLRIGQQDVYFVEGGSNNLRRYEGSQVRMTGTVQANSAPDALPVFIVASITSLSGDPVSHTIHAPSLQIDLPPDWVPRPSAAYATAVVYEPTGQVILRLQTLAESVLPEGSPLMVQGRPAVRTESEDSTDVYIQAANGIIHVQFTPPTDSPALQQQFADAISSIQFPSTSSAQSSKSGTLGIPCGGAAGILCPKGQFCDLRLGEQGSGRCRSFNGESGVQ